MSCEKRDEVATKIRRNQIKLLEQGEDWDSESRISKIVGTCQNNGDMVNKQKKTSEDMRWDIARSCE